MHRKNAQRPRPLPGTEPPVRALFVDRWGTLLALPEGGRLPRFDPALFLPGAVDALFRACQAGWIVYLIGNEDAVAHGRASDQSWEQFEQQLLAHLLGQGVPVKRCYACLDHPEGKAPHRKRSVFQLPDTGLLYHAQQSEGVVLHESWVLGDGPLELAAGSRAGCHLGRVRVPGNVRDELHVDAELFAPDLRAALAEVLVAKLYARS